MADEKDRFLEKIDDVIKRQQQNEVLEGMLAGKSQAQISRDTGMSEYVVKARKLEIITAQTQHFHDEREWALAKAAARLEKIYGAAEPWAFGTAKLDAEGNAIPDRQWQKFLLDVIDRQVRLYSNTEVPESVDQTLNMTKIEHLTINTNSPMAEFAKNAMWMEHHGYEPEQLVNTLLEQDKQTVDLTQPLKLKKRIDNLSQLIIGEDDNDDSDL